MTLIQISSHEAQSETFLISYIAHAKALMYQAGIENPSIYLALGLGLRMLVVLEYNL